MIEEKFKHHFFVVHTFVSEEARKEYLTPPEKRNPPSQRETEKEWAEQAVGEIAQCMQTWVGNDDFFYCHWVADSEDDVYRQLEEWEIEGKYVNSRINEVQQFVTAYRASEKIFREYPDNDGKW